MEKSITPAALWAMLTVHVRFSFYEAPEGDDDVDPDLLSRVSKENDGKRLPFVPMWLLADRRG